MRADRVERHQGKVAQPKVDTLAEPACESSESRPFHRDSSRTGTAVIRDRYWTGFGVSVQVGLANWIVIMGPSG